MSHPGNYLKAVAAFQRARPSESAPSQRASETDLAWLADSVALILGFTLQFNLLTLTFGWPILRLSDGTVIIAAAIFSLIALKRAINYTVIATAIGLILLSLLLKSSPGKGDAYQSLILIASIWSAATFVSVGQTRVRLFDIFAWGSLTGFFLSAAILFAKTNGASLNQFGMGVPTGGTSDFIRNLAQAKPGGIWTHGNEAGHVFALAAAPALYLSIRRQKLLIYLAYFAVFMITFTVTLNRGGLIFPFVGVFAAVWFIGKRKSAVQLVTVPALLAIIMLAAYFLPAFDAVRTSLEARFLADTYISENLSERLLTVASALQIAIGNPFGIGYAERTSQIAYLAHGMRTPHNGFLSLAFQAGLGFLVLYVAALSRHVARWRQFQLPTVIALSAAPSLLFEEISGNPVFLFYISVAVASAWTILVRRKARPNVDFEATRARGT